MAVVLETSDAGVADEALSSLYNVQRLNGSGADLYVCIRQDHVGPVGLHNLHLLMDGRLGGLPPGALRIIHLLQGRTTRERGRESTSYGPHDVYLSAQPEAPIEGDLHRAEFELAILQPSILSEVVDAPSEHPLEPVRLTSYEPFTTRHAARWVATYRYVRSTLTAPLAGDTPLLDGPAARLLAAATLATFPNTSSGEDSRRDRRDAHPETLRRAIVFVDENADRDISVADIANASFASVRSVQLAFRRHLDTTPLRYLQQVRLDHAHRQLTLADPSEQSVAVIARQWGFSNPSRFASLYRSTYGVLPSSTLRSD